jgi:hypothetical protein
VWEERLIPPRDSLLRMYTRLLLDNVWGGGGGRVLRTESGLLASVPDPDPRIQRLLMNID